MRRVREQVCAICAFRAGRLDCFVARAPRNDGVKFALNYPRHCERSEGIQEQRDKRQFVNELAA
jgi:hypothetical protein